MRTYNPRFTGWRIFKMNNGIEIIHCRDADGWGFRKRCRDGSVMSMTLHETAHAAAAEARATESAHYRHW